MFGRAPSWTLLKIAYENVEFVDAAPYVGMDNLDIAAAIERDFNCVEREDMAHGAHHQRRREPGAVRRHHGRHQGDLGTRRRRRQDGLAQAQGHHGARRAARTATGASRWPSTTR
jgi:hypothetical protein